MEIKNIIKNQYHASLDMLGGVIAKCPESIWITSNSVNQFWRIAFHALFYTHLYLQSTEEEFIPWSKHREQAQFLGRLPWPPHAEPKIGKPYDKGELLEYLEFCHAEVEKRVDGLDWEKASGFSWQPFNKLELQIYNIRHLQQHVGELSERLGTNGVEIDWIGTSGDKK